MMDVKNKTACFTGHRKLPAKKVQLIISRLDKEVNRLIREGVTTFLFGGALGFDQIASSLIAAKKEMGINVRLIMALPHRGQDDLWTNREKELYNYLLGAADEVIYISESYSSDCMKKRNYYMVDKSEYCICAFTKEISGTGQTVRYAKQKKLQIINVAK